MLDPLEELAVCRGRCGRGRDRAGHSDTSPSKSLGWTLTSPRRNNRVQDRRRTPADVPKSDTIGRSLGGERRYDAPVSPRAEHAMTVSAYILIQTEVGKASAVVAAVRTLPGVVQADDVTGPYDVILRAEAVVDRRARPHGRVADPARRRHHPHPDLPRRAPVGRCVVVRLWPTRVCGSGTQHESVSGARQARRHG